MVTAEDIQGLLKQFQQIVDRVISGAFSLEEVKALLQQIIEKVYVVEIPEDLTVEIMKQRLQFLGWADDSILWEVLAQEPVQPGRYALRLIALEQTLSDASATLTVNAQGFRRVRDPWVYLTFLAENHELISGKTVVSGLFGTSSILAWTSCSIGTPAESQQLYGAAPVAAWLPWAYLLCERRR